jgi:hypothetical protein
MPGGFRGPHHFSRGLNRQLPDETRGGIASSSGGRRIVIGAHNRPDKAFGYIDGADLFAARGDARPPGGMAHSRRLVALNAYGQLPDERYAIYGVGH